MAHAKTPGERTLPSLPRDDLLTTSELAMATGTTAPPGEPAQTGPGGEEPAIATESLDGPAPMLVGGRFQILGLIGSGGMGSVYKARDTELDEIVALKMLRRDAVDSPRVLERFRKEAKLARRVTHPNVARTFDIGEHQNEKFLTMEYIDGESLGSLLARERVLPLARVVELALPICAGLSAAHAAGVVHRDLKPDNVLIGKNGRVVITDFGIARIALDAPGSTQTIGTPTYMAPEQVEGTAVDGRSDIYALGVMLYEMLTGDRPWKGAAFAVAAARLIAPPPDPRKILPSLPDAVAELVLRCMARDPKDRFASAAEVRTAFRRLDLGVADPEMTPLPAEALQPALRQVDPLASSLSSARTHTLAVLPFRNAGHPEDDHWAEGFTDDLIDTLSMIPGLKVRSRGAVLPYRRTERDPRQVGWELGVQVVVEGSVRRHGATLRVTTRLISVGDGFQIWGRRFDRPDTDLLAVADEAAQAIAAALDRPFDRPAREGGGDAVALDLYLRARKAHHEFTRSATLRARDLLAQALARCPDNPSFLAGYALVQARIWGLSLEEGDCRERALEAAERARSLAPHLGEAHLALASVYFQEQRVREAIAELKQALAKTPSLPEAHEMVARLQIEAGSLEEGLTRMEKALSLEPAMVRARHEMARAQALLGNWTECWAQLGRDDRSFGHWLTECRLLLWAGDRARAEKLLLEREQVPNPIAEYLIDSLLGRPMSPTSQEMIHNLATSDGPVRRKLYFMQLQVEISALKGELEQAFAQLAQATSLGLFDINWLDRCPLLEPVRRHPRVERLRPQIRTNAQRVTEALGQR